MSSRSARQAPRRPAGNRTRAKLRDDRLPLLGLSILARLNENTPRVVFVGGEPGHLGRTRARPDLSLPSHPKAIVIGDPMVLERDGQLFSPGLATVAVQQRMYVRALVARRACGQRDLPPFPYKDEGQLATVARSFAIADFDHFTFPGFLAWILWWTLHITCPANLWDRFLTLSTWVWPWLRYERSVRLLALKSAGLQQVGWTPAAVQTGQPQ